MSVEVKLPPSDDEIWAWSLKVGARAEWRMWMIGLFGTAFAPISYLLSPTLASLNHGIGWVATFSGAALLFRLSTQYWRQVGPNPQHHYWRRVWDLGPQSIAVAVASFSTWGAWLDFATPRQAGGMHLSVPLLMGAVGAVLSTLWVLACASRPNMRALRRHWENDV